jgi:membrane protease YdiL (CAAX protease family)
MLAVVVIVGAPVVEELFFRGLVLRSLQRRFGDGWAVAGSAVAFGLAHFEPLQLPALVVLGVVLGVLALRTGRLGPGMFAHGAFNAITIIALALQR